MRENETYCAALRCFGVRNQTVVAIEEMSELQKELCKMLRGQANAEHIAEEIADVEIMLAQMIEALQLQKEVAKYKYFKLVRLEARIDAAERRKERTDIK